MAHMGFVSKDPAWPLQAPLTSAVTSSMQSLGWNPAIGKPRTPGRSLPTFAQPSRLPSPIRTSQICISACPTRKCESPPFSCFTAAEKRRASEEASVRLCVSEVISFGLVSKRNPVAKYPALKDVCFAVLNSKQQLVVSLSLQKRAADLQCSVPLLG